LEFSLLILFKFIFGNQRLARFPFMSRGYFDYFLLYSDLSDYFSGFLAVKIDFVISYHILDIRHDLSKRFLAAS